MRGSPVRNFLCVIALLAVMAAAVSLATRRPGDAGEAGEKAPSNIVGESHTVEMDLRMRFSHLPKKVSLIPADGGAAVFDTQPTENYLEKTLTLPADRVSELLLDIEWPEKEHAVYFVMITERRQGLEDVDVILTSDDLIFSSVLTIDPRNKNP